MGQARLELAVLLVVGACCAVGANAQSTAFSRSAVTLQAPAKVAIGGGQAAGPGDRLDAIVPIVTEGFEGAFPGSWTIRYGGTKAWWGTSTVRATAGARSAYCAAGGEPPAPSGGPYFPNMNTWLVRGPFSLADATAGRFTVPFWLKTQLEHDYFGYLVSIDGDQFHGNWWSGDTQGWRTETIDLVAVPNLGSVLGRSQVWIALVFQSDAATQLEGVYVDDVYLEKTTTAPPCTLTCNGSSPATGVAGVTVQFTGQATATNCTGAINYAWDFADGTVGSTLQSPTHAYAQAGTYPWRFTATVADKTCSEDGFITITNPVPCSLACTATVPQSALVGAPVSVAATATPSNCTGSPGFSWDWGDGTAFGTQANTIHTYNRAGTFGWRMTASIDGKTCTKNGTVTVRDTPPIAEAGSHVYVLASSGHLAGAVSSNWVSDAVLHNPGASEVTAYLYFLRKGINGTNAAGQRVTVPAGRSVKLVDLVLAIFGQSSASGAVLVGCEQPLVITSRTYNTAAKGTFGQYIEGYPTAQAVAGTEEVRLIGLARNAIYRTNIGFANASGAQTDVAVEMHRADGSLLGTKPVKVEPWGYAQENDIIAAYSQSVDNAYAIVKSAQVGARFFTYASVIDGRTNDPIQVVPVGRQAQQAASSGLRHVDPASTVGAVAGVNEWTLLNLKGAPVTAVAVHPTNPSTVWIGTANAGFWRTADGGATWSASGLEGDTVQALAVSPGNPSLLLAYTSWQGALRSTDGGATWTKMSLSVWRADAIAFDPVSPQVAYLLGGSVELFKTTDGGATWTQVGGSTVQVGNCLAIDPRNPSTLYAGGTVSQRGSIRKSSDGGSTWAPLATGLPGGSVASLAVDPSNSSILYAGTSWYWGPGQGVLKSTNGGTTWTPVNSGLGETRSVDALAIDPSSPSTVYAANPRGVWKSTNGGASWAAASTGLNHWNTVALAIAPSSPQTLLAATGRGLFRSTNGAAAWTPVSSSVGGFSVSTLVIDPRDPRIMLAGGGSGGVMRSTDGGASWVSALGAITSAPIETLLLDPSNPSAAYVSTFGEGVLKSIDGGVTWNQVNSGIVNLDTVALAIDPSNPGTLYAGCYYGRYFNVNPSQLYKTTSGGASWTSTGLGNPGSLRRLLVDPQSSTTLYAAVDLSGGVFKSTTGGASWTAANSGMTNQDLDMLAIHPIAHLRLFASGRIGFFKTINGAASWAQIAGALARGPVYSLAFHPSGTGTVFAGSDGVWRSTDWGETWQTVGNGPAAAIGALAVDPVDPANVLAGSASGLFKITLVDCTYVLSPTSKSFTHAGGSGTVTVTVGDSRCTWSAASNAAWLTVTSSGTGTGTGSVGYAVAANTTTTQRTGTLTIAGQTFTVTQDGKPAGPEPIYVPGAAHVAGSAGTNWRTDLEVHNPGATQASYTIALLKRDQDNPSPTEKPYTLGPGLSIRYPDALSDLFSHSGGATLRVMATQGQVMVTSRTYNDQPDGTFGQFVPGAPLSVAFGPGVDARLVQLAYSTDPKQGFRTNIGLVNASSLTIAVWVDLYRSDGTKLGTRGASLGPFKFIQFNDVFDSVTTANVPDGFALVRTTTAGGSFFAYASVIDNLSGDPIYIPARVPAQ